ncbi:hypothetical protein HNR34_000067 [Geobacillus subterraneus]
MTRNNGHGNAAFAESVEEAVFKAVTERAAKGNLLSIKKTCPMGTGLFCMAIVISADG